MMSSRAALVLFLALAAFVLVAAAPEAGAKPQKKVAVGHYLVKVQDHVKALVKSVKSVHSQDPYVVYALVGTGFVLGALFYLVFSPSKSGHRKPSGFKRKQK